MEMCYDGALVMPEWCVTVDYEEMEYIDGGFSREKNSLGYKITLTAQECGDLAAVAAAGVAGAGAVSAILGLSGVGTGAAIALAITAGILGVGSAYLWMCSNHKGATLQAFVAGNVYLGTTHPVIRW